MAEGLRIEHRAKVSLEHTRIEKAASDAGFDLTVEHDGDWLVFSSTAFPVIVGIRVNSTGYDMGFSDDAVGLRMAGELGLSVDIPCDSWSIQLLGLDSYKLVYQALMRSAQIARAVAVSPASEFEAMTKQLPDNTEVQRMVTQRIGQYIFRKLLLDYWGNRCAVTGLDLPDLLLASHIKAWSKCESSAERLDVYNGLLLAPQLDAAFDHGWITFEDTGAIRVSLQLTAEQRYVLGIKGAEKILGLTDRHRNYLLWHREHCFRA